MLCFGFTLLPTNMSANYVADHMECEAPRCLALPQNRSSIHLLSRWLFMSHSFFLLATLLRHGLSSAGWILLLRVAIFIHYHHDVHWGVSETDYPALKSTDNALFADM